MIINYNVGLLGHVDSGKTTLARALSTTASTAAFDKNPQSQQRGITLDLGFSSVQMEPSEALLEKLPTVQKVQFTFVDCPGHASLIRTIIGGAQIIDLMLLIIDAGKGMQTQTAECLVIGELLCPNILLVVNKIDQLETSKRDAVLQKIDKQLIKLMSKTKFGGNVPIYHVAAQSALNVQELLDGLHNYCSYIPDRKTSLPLLLYVDHCFAAKGQGTICTGTIIQGELKVNDTVELPAIQEQRKVKSIQMFRRAMQSAHAGDRIGLCVTQFNPKLLERGLITQPGYLERCYAACIALKRIPYYKYSIKSKSKVHISVGHDTVMAHITLFQSAMAENVANEQQQFSLDEAYEYVDELEAADGNVNSNIYALLQFERAIWSPPNAILIASKLDMDVHTTCCRLMFWGRMQWQTFNANYEKEQLPRFRVFKHKLKEGTIKRIVNEQEVVVENLFNKGTIREVFLGKSVSLTTGELGCIDSCFGQSAKVKIRFAAGLKAETLEEFKNNKSKVKVQLRFRKNIFNKQAEILQ